jgi:hypothetical protein
VLARPTQLIWIFHHCINVLYCQDYGHVRCDIVVCWMGTNISQIQLKCRYLYTKLHITFQKTIILSSLLWDWYSHVFDCIWQEHRILGSLEASEDESFAVGLLIDIEDDSLRAASELITINHTVIYQWTWNLGTVTQCLPSQFAPFPLVCGFTCCVTEWSISAYVSMFMKTNFSNFCNPIIYQCYILARFRIHWQIIAWFMLINSVSRH